MDADPHGQGTGKGQHQRQTSPLTNPDMNQVIHEAPQKLECQESQEQDNPAITEPNGEELRTPRTSKSQQPPKTRTTPALTARTIQIGEENGMLVIAAPSKGQYDYK